MLFASFFMYEALWSVIELQFDDVGFVAEEMAWDFAQCALFTTVVFAVSWGFAKYRGGRYARGVVEIATLLVVNAVVIFLTDKVFNEGDEADVNFWGVIDIYVICIICSLLSIIDIQRFYYKRFVAIRQEQMQLRLNLLQQQLSPHFMFNSLSTLRGIIVADPQRAEGYVIELSNILRYITENIGSDKVTIADAMNFIRNYMKMQDVRFPEHFRFNIDESDMPTGAYVVPVSLQIAVENAIKHNNHSRRCPLEISIKFHADAVEVSNKKQPLTYADNLGVGLKNLSERCVLLTGKGVEVDETKDNYTVKIPLVFDRPFHATASSKLVPAWLNQNDDI